jgi:hypothetical protein
MVYMVHIQCLNITHPCGHVVMTTHIMCCCFLGMHQRGSAAVRDSIYSMSTLSMTVNSDMSVMDSIHVFMGIHTTHYSPPSRPHRSSTDLCASQFDRIVIHVVHVDMHMVSYVSLIAIIISHVPIMSSQLISRQNGGFSRRTTTQTQSQRSCHHIVPTFATHYFNDKNNIYHMLSHRYHS